MTEAAIAAGLLEENRAQCDPPLHEDEVRAIAESAATYAPTGEAPTADADNDIRFEPLTAREIVALPDPPTSDELLGPVLVRGYRLVLGAHTGDGKTSFALRMIRAVLNSEEFLGWRGAGAGRILIIDLEQGLRSIKRRLREAGLDETDKIDYLRVPDGLLLDKSPRQREALGTILEHCRYDVVLLDPEYKAHGGDSNSEQEKLALMRVLDGWRSGLHFALILPAHCRKPPVGSKFSIHDIFGSTVLVRGAEVVLGLQRVSDGYSRLHFFKDRDGDLPVGSSWGLLFDPEGGYRRDPKDDEAPRDLELDVRAYLVEHANEWHTVAEIGAKKEKGGVGARRENVTAVLGALVTEGFAEYAKGPTGRKPHAECYRHNAPCPGPGTRSSSWAAQGHMGGQLEPCPTVSIGQGDVVHDAQPPAPPCPVPGTGTPRQPAPTEPPEDAGW